MLKPESIEAETHINGLPLPPALLALMRTGQWKCPDDRAAWNRVFLEQGSDPMLYTLHSVRRENQYWPDEKSRMFLGAADAAKSPGDIDPRLSVLVGDLGIGSDQPIALDYRCSRESPRVLTLAWSASAINNRWIEIAPDIMAFVALIGL